MGKNEAKQRGKKEASPTKIEKGPYKKPGNNISKKRHSMDCSPPGYSVHGIFQARVLEWGAIVGSTVN